MSGGTNNGNRPDEKTVTEVPADMEDSADMGHLYDHLRELQHAADTPDTGRRSQETMHTAIHIQQPPVLSRGMKVFDRAGLAEAFLRGGPLWYPDPDGDRGRRPGGRRVRHNMPTILPRHKHVRGSDRAWTSIRRQHAYIHCAECENNTREGVI